MTTGGPRPDFPRTAPPPDAEQRSCWGASWFKLCDPDPAIEDPTALIKGMYFALDHFEELLATQRGPRDGIRIGYDDVDRYFSNTMFSTSSVTDGSAAEVPHLKPSSLSSGKSRLRPCGHAGPRTTARAPGMRGRQCAVSTALPSELK